MQRAAMLLDKFMTLGCTGNKCYFLLSLESPSQRNKPISKTLRNPWGPLAKGIPTNSYEDISDVTLLIGLCILGFLPWYQTYCMQTCKNIARHFPQHLPTQPLHEDNKCTPCPRQVYIIMVVAHAERDHMEAKENALADHAPNQQL